MLIVKPYGRSETVRDGKENLRRELRLKPRLGDTIGDSLGDVVEFAGSHPELVIAQWISVIDKIAAKPRGRGKPTAGQRRLREALGRAAFDMLMNEVLAGCRDRRDEFKRLGRLWKSKIHPYGSDDDEQRSGGEKGRWYARFAGDTDPAGINATKAEEIARKIRNHLHSAEYRIDGRLPKKRQGQISARAESIAGNVVALNVRVDEHSWSSEDRERYAAAGDVAGAIKSAAQKRESGADGTGSRRVGPDVAARQLYLHWARLFRDDRGQALSVADARKGMPDLFALHGAVRDAYSRILKRHKKHRRRQGGGSPPISALLPGTMDELYRLVEARERNRNLNALVRLGKVIHYEAADGGGDEPGQLLVEKSVKQFRERHDLAPRPAPVLGREAVQGQMPYTVFRRRPNDPPRRLGALEMPGGARQSARDRPAPVSVHDDRDMCGQASRTTFGQRRHRSTCLLPGRRRRRTKSRRPPRRAGPARFRFHSS